MRPGLNQSVPLMIAALAGVWALNFFVVLPIISPAFVHLVPYAVSLTSKLLFGVAAAATLRRQDASRTAAGPAPEEVSRMVLRAVNAYETLGAAAKTSALKVLIAT